MWDLIVSVPDHCLSFYFPLHNARPTLKIFCFPLPDSIKKRRVGGICYF